MWGFQGDAEIVAEGILRRNGIGKKNCMQYHALFEAC